jgi:hypothetical protein
LSRAYAEPINHVSRRRTVQYELRKTNIDIAINEDGGEGDWHLPARTPYLSRDADRPQLVQLSPEPEIALGRGTFCSPPFSFLILIVHDLGQVQAVDFGFL